MKHVRDRPLNAADDFGQAWGRALVAVNKAITALEDRDATLVGQKVAEASDLISKAATLCVRIELLFGPSSLVDQNADALHGEIREALRSVGGGNVPAATRWLRDASASLYWLSLAMVEAIQKTGTRDDDIREVKHLRKVELVDPEKRRKTRHAA